MFAFFIPKHVKEGRIVARHARKILRYKRDILPVARLAQLQELLVDLNAAVKSRDAGAIANARAVVEKEYSLIPGAMPSGLQENVEVIVVAIVIALGVRAYFLQPFKIPTGSMQPTLNGIIAHKTDAPQPNAAVQLWERIVRGRHYVNVRAIEDDEILALVPRRKALFFTETEVVCAKNKYVVAAERDTLRQFGLPEVEKVTGRVLPRADRFGNIVPYRIRKGDPIAVGYVETGDQVFVDKMSYHFFPPGRSDVFVFKTTGIRAIERTQDPGMGSQHYIKRLAGLPGDELRIDPPRLYINGELAKEAGFRRVIASTDGYRGYGSGRQRDPAGDEFPTDYLGTPTATVKLGPDEFFALGDNSYSSFDSRNWGVVRERNLVGRGLVVYYPFNEHWGLIR